MLISLTFNLCSCKEIAFDLQILISLKSERSVECLEDERVVAKTEGKLKLIFRNLQDTQ